MDAGWVGRGKPVYMYMVLFFLLGLTAMRMDHLGYNLGSDFFFVSPVAICRVKILLLAGHKGITAGGFPICGILC